MQRSFPIAVASPQGYTGLAGFGIAASSTGVLARWLAFPSPQHYQARLRRGGRRQRVATR